MSSGVRRVRRRRQEDSVEPPNTSSSYDAVKKEQDVNLKDIKEKFDKVTKKVDGAPVHFVVKVCWAIAVFLLFSLALYVGYKIFYFISEELEIILSSGDRYARIKGVEKLRSNIIFTLLIMMVGVILILSFAIFGSNAYFRDTKVHEYEQRMEIISIGRSAFEEGTNYIALINRELGREEANAKIYKKLKTELDDKISKHLENADQDKKEINELTRQKEEVDRELLKAQSEMKDKKEHLQSVKEELEIPHEEVKSIGSGKDKKGSCIIS